MSLIKALCVVSPLSFVSAVCNHAPPYKVLVNDCGLDVKDHVFHGRTKLGDISENLAKSNPLKLDAGVDNV